MKEVFEKIDAILQKYRKSGWNNQTQNHVKGLNVYLTIVWIVC